MVEEESFSKNGEKQKIFYVYFRVVLDIHSSFPAKQRENVKIIR
jgi:hypothetical protein